MFVNQYRIHFVNGQVISVAECVEKDNEMSSDLIDRFMEALPGGVLMVGTEDTPQAFIPVNNILYISQIPDDCL